MSMFGSHASLKLLQTLLKLFQLYTQSVEALSNVAVISDDGEAREFRNPGVDENNISAKGIENFLLIAELCVL